MQKRKWIYAIVGAVVLVVVYFVAFHKSDTQPLYRFDKVSRGDVSLTISATGTLSADTTVQVGSQVSGRIAELYADFNSKVREGQLLAQIDPTFLKAAVDQQKAAVVKARAQMDDSKRTFVRTDSLFRHQLAAQADLDAATTTYESDKASLQQAEAALEQAEVNLRYAAIRAPISGVVISRNVDVGQTVAASLQAPTLFTIANDLRKMQVQADVDEADIGNVRVGQSVTFRVDAFPNRMYDGSVMQVRLAPVVTENVVMYTVIISVANKDLSLMPGMTATVSVLVARRENVLRVPIQAVRFTPPGESPLEDTARDSSAAHRSIRRHHAESSTAADTPGTTEHARVWIAKGNQAVPVDILGGLQNDQYVEIVRGDLQEGEDVIVGMESTTDHQSFQTTTPFGPQRFGRGPRR
jgi:HlyD family secretion protein